MFLQVSQKLSRTRIACAVSGSLELHQFAQHDAAKLRCFSDQSFPACGSSSKIQVARLIIARTFLIVFALESSMSKLPRSGNCQRTFSNRVKLPAPFIMHGGSFYPINAERQVCEYSSNFKSRWFDPTEIEPP